MDKGHRYTDKQIELLEKRLERHYQGVSAEARKKLIKYLKDNQERYTELWRQLDEGEITEAQFDYLIMSDNELESIQGELVNTYVEGDAKAMSIVGAALGVVFAYNHNYQGDKMRAETGLTIPKVRKRMLPPPNPDKMKDRIWHRVKIRLVVNHGIKHGRTTAEVADELNKVTNMDLNAAYRAARTACTNAENQGKLNAMLVLRDKYGVDVKKQWYATLDNRTRTQHREMHGEIRELEETFSNGLLYPADPDGNPSEVWNCRCTLIDVISGMDDIQHAPSGMSRSEWIKKEPVTKSYPLKYQTEKQKRHGRNNRSKSR
jgi:SPP1 gp7 family putative phage head morphogenesis protein